MTVAELILALSALPPEARVIVEFSEGDDEFLIETYAHANMPVVRYLHPMDQGIQWDITPAAEPYLGAETVVLIAPVVSERPLYSAPVPIVGGGARYTKIDDRQETK